VLELKSIAGVWLLPLPLALIATLGGLLLQRSGRTRAAVALLAAAVALVFIPAFGPVANVLVRPLETRYSAVLDASKLPRLPQYVAVLGSGYRPRPSLAVTGALDVTGVVRLFEGIRLWRQLPAGALLILSGGVHGDHPPIARGYALGAISLGVPAAAIVTLEEPLDTAAEVRAIHARVGTAPVIIVSSAVHMPRVMALASRDGLQAIAAPADVLSDPDPHGPWLGLAPSATTLRRSEAAIHEYLGLLAIHSGMQ
jgi:uncharacterized SAM-binding protein YcdF (DUF218 family)